MTHRNAYILSSSYVYMVYIWYIYIYTSIHRKCKAYSYVHMKNIFVIIIIILVYTFILYDMIWALPFECREMFVQARLSVHEFTVNIAYTYIIYISDSIQMETKLLWMYLRYTLHVSSFHTHFTCVYYRYKYGTYMWWLWCLYITYIRVYM